MKHSDDYIPALRFHVLTGLYDPVVRVTTRERRIKQQLVEGLGNPKRVLDLGSGTGTLLRLIGDRFPAAELCGVDRDPRIITIARGKLGDAAHIERGDVVAPPFPPDSFDRIVSSLVFHHLTTDQKLKALRAARALLKPGGELHLADWCEPHDSLMRAAFFAVQYLDGFATTRDNVLGRLPQLMAEAGFSSIEMTYRQRTPLGSMSILRAQR